MAGSADSQFSQFEPKKQAVLISLSQGSKISPACEAAGISRRTFYNWLDDDSKFARAVQLMEEAAIDVIEDALWLHARAGNPSLIKYYLSNKRPKDWKNTARVEMTGENGGPIRTEDVVLSDETRITRIMEILDASRTRGNSASTGEAEVL